VDDRQPRVVVRSRNVVSAAWNLRKLSAVRPAIPSAQAIACRGCNEGERFVSCINLSQDRRSKIEKGGRIGVKRADCGTRGVRGRSPAITTEALAPWVSYGNHIA